MTDSAEIAPERFGVPGDPEADEQLRADLAAVREAEREAFRNEARQIHGGSDVCR